MPLRDYTTLIRVIAENTHSLEELQREAIRNGFIAAPGVIQLPRRLDGIGSRLHALLIYAGARLAAVGVEDDGMEASTLRELARIIGAPIVSVGENVQVYASA